MNIGVIGTGWITDAFIEGTRRTEGFQPVAVYSRTQASASEFASKHKLDYAFTDLKQMAESSFIDCVYIASPNSMHYEQAMIFLQEKKHVICEKPIFSNLAEWTKAYETAEAKGVYLFEAMRNLFTPNLEKLKGRLDEIGPVRSAILPFIQYSSRYDKYLNGERPNVLTSEFSGGALVDLGVYSLSLAVVLFGKPDDARYFPVKLDSGIDGNGTLVLQYPEMTCTIMCSKISQSYLACEIHGESGTLTFDGAGELNDAKLFKQNDPQQGEPLGSVTYANNMNFEAEAFYNIIRKQDNEVYEQLKDLSYAVLEITEKVRKQNGIVFGSEV